MNRKYLSYGKYPHWLPDNSYSLRKHPEALKVLSNDRGSLTTALLTLSDGAFAVNVLSQKIHLPFYHEQIKLARPLHKAAMIRQVELLIQDIPVVYARSIVPLNLVSNGKNGLANLGRTPLGHLLFKDGRIRVSKRDFALVESEKTAVAARRTPYEYQDSTILVSEFFLPSLQQFL